MIEVLHQQGSRRLVKFSRGVWASEKGDYWYRSERIAGSLVLGTTYDTYDEALAAYLHSIKEHHGN